MDDLRAAKGNIVVEPPPMCQNGATVARIYEAAKSATSKLCSKVGKLLCWQSIEEE